MSDFITKLSELIDPEVMGDMVSARIQKKLRVAPFYKIDDTLQGVPGDTITVPAYTYIGDASDVAEGGEVAIEKMTTSTRKATIKKAMKGIGLTDEAVLSGYGNPVGEANTQLAMAIAAKILEGKKVAPNVRCIVMPATQSIYKECIQRGYITTFIDAGCAVSTPTCGPCLGGHMGVMANGEKCVATTNRNFVGRMGGITSEIYLASPAVAAASAIAGKIADPREV